MEISMKYLINLMKYFISLMKRCHERIKPSWAYEQKNLPLLRSRDRSLTQPLAVRTLPNVQKYLKNG